MVAAYSKLAVDKAYFVIWLIKIRKRIGLNTYQRRAVIFVNGDYSKESSVTSMLNEPKWPALQQRRTNIKMIMMYRIVQMSSLYDL
jgi:hypothetical protein